MLSQENKEQSNGERPIILPLLSTLPDACRNDLVQRHGLSQAIEWVITDYLNQSTCFSIFISAKKMCRYLEPGLLRDGLTYCYNYHDGLPFSAFALCVRPSMYEMTHNIENVERI